MGYLIDGHNLIPKIPGLNLRQMDDETDLIGILQSFCSAKQKDAVVFFDGAPPGYDGTRNYGRVTAVFVQAGKNGGYSHSGVSASVGKSRKELDCSDFGSANSIRSACHGGWNALFGCLLAATCDDIRSSSCWQEGQ